MVRTSCNIQTQLGAGSGGQGWGNCEGPGGRTWALVTDPTDAPLVAPAFEPRATPADCLRRKDAGGVLSSRLKLLSCRWRRIGPVSERWLDLCAKTTSAKVIHGHSAHPGPAHIVHSDGNRDDLASLVSSLGVVLFAECHDVHTLGDKQNGDSCSLTCRGVQQTGMGQSRRLPRRFAQNGSLDSMPLSRKKPRRARSVPWSREPDQQAEQGSPFRP